MKSSGFRDRPFQRNAMSNGTQKEIDMNSAPRRLARFFRLLPETCINCLRFRVAFLLPRWFRMPARVRVAHRSVALQIPEDDGVAADFISCILRNDYGLGRGLSRISTIVDVGANLGFFSLAARARYPTAAIHAYEPNPRIQPLLRSNTSGMGILIHPEAVGRSDGVGRLIDDGPSNQARIAAGEDGPFNCEVPQVSLAEVLRRAGARIDLLKLDCEGAEWQILQPDPCWEFIRNIRIEYHLFHGETAEQAERAVLELGFRILQSRRFNPQSGMVWAARD